MVSASRYKILSLIHISPEERARRRYEELLSRGEKVLYDDVLADVKKRDYNDSHRPVSPLKQAPDAVLLDTTGNTFEQSVSQMTALVRTSLERCV